MQLSTVVPWGRSFDEYQRMFCLTPRDLEFHVAAILDLLRVATEVRIFPLLTLDHQPSPHLPPVLQRLQSSGYVTQIIATDYEFQIAPAHFGNRMLRITASPGKA